MSVPPPNYAPSQTELNALFAAQAEYAPRLAKTTVRERKSKLSAVLASLVDHEAEILAALEKDFNKPEQETLLTEMGVVASQIRHIRRHLRKWMKPKAVPTPLSMLGTQSYIHKEAKGQALIISPWNYPLNLSLVPAVYAIAAGCTVILKPSEFTPNTTAIVRKMVSTIFPPEEFSIVEGEGATAAALTAMPFNHIFFTGSPKIGKLVMEAAGKNLTSVTLELGGKSPAIIDETVSIDHAAAKACWAKYLNGGQTCVAPDYFLVHRDQFEDFKVAIKNKISDFFGADTSTSGSLAHIINDRHYERLQALLDDALEKGAELLVGGSNDPSSRYFAPTVLTNVTTEMRVMQEEIFGPIMPITAYDSLEEVVNTVNARPRPLTMYINSKRQATINHLMENSRAGSTVINDYMLSFSNPYLHMGGVNNSGIGKSQGYHGFLEFTNERSVIRRRFLNLDFIFPPYTEQKYTLAKWLFKIQ